MGKDIKPANPVTVTPSTDDDPKADERKTSAFKIGRKLACIRVGRKTNSAKCF